MCEIINSDLFIVIAIMVWCIIGFYIGVMKGDLWHMIVTLPISIVLGPLAYIFMHFYNK